ncbi:alpha/beta hydrolase [Oryzifoliimicrobium ureilyticus]|uniref:alpha/beta hydrolase n=1 Tax=Oryzifoliimicrobium ureilyticus TaxID=3113724 RepID=UPI003075EFE3
MFVLLAALAGCAARPGPDVLKVSATTQPVPGARTVKVYVATTRERKAPGENIFTNGRSFNINYAEFTISVPPGHKAGNIEWPSGKPDPRRDFVTIEQRALDRTSFEREIERSKSPRKPDVGVFVHGFNNNFQESLYRLVQISADAGNKDVPILFAWPSQASITGYVADKDSVTFSRDSLVDTLTMLGKNPKIGKIDVLGHSMGTWLTVEAVRQLRLTKQDAVIHRLNVILAAPDIDVDVFREQLAVIGPLSPPMTLLVSKDDKALAVSSFISQDHQRLGTIDVSDPEVQAAAKKADVQIIDISELSAADGFNHDRYARLAAMYPQLAEKDKNGSGNIRKAGAFIFNSVGATLASPFTLAGKVVSGE